MHSLNSLVREERSPIAKAPPPRIWHPHEPDLERRKEGITVIDDLETLESTVEEILLRWHQNSPESNFYISLDGLPGAGKTSLMECLQNICSRRGIQLHVNGIDKFLGSSREDRLGITENADIMAERYFSQGAVMGVMEKIHAANGFGSRIHVPRMYHRAEGIIAPGNIDVPAGRKVVVLEGVHSSRVLSKLEKSHGAKILNIHVSSDPSKSLKRAVDRDSRKGGNWSRSAAQFHQEGVYSHLLKSVHTENPKIADILFEQN